MRLQVLTADVVDLNAYRALRRFPHLATSPGREQRPVTGVAPLHAPASATPIPVLAGPRAPIPDQAA